jgi:general secretion pathway protein C
MNEENQDSNKSDVAGQNATPSNESSLHPESVAQESRQESAETSPTPQDQSTKLTQKLHSFSDRARTGLTQLKSRLQDLSNPSEGSRLQAGLKWETLLHSTIQLLKSGKLAPLGTALTILLSTWFLSDISGLYLESFLPEAPPHSLSRSAPRLNLNASGGDPVQIIVARNLFSSQGIIPGEEQPSGPIDPGGAPIKTSLPLNLIGTLILRNELRSIATIEDKAASQVYPVRMDDEIPGKAKIISIESRKVVFLNLASSRREYVELPLDAALANSKISLGSKSLGGGGTPQVESVGNNQFNVSRSAVDQALADLPKVLTQARAVPNIENGIANGYKLFQIIPGSIYQTIGLQNGDTLLAVDGTPMNDPGKAFELLNQLKTASRMELTVKRNGKVQNFTYEIR